jgi:hypothetical protein
MVQKGDFTVEIVNADTKEPFLEHKGPAPNYETFVEVEPDMEYYIKVTGVNLVKAYVHVEVDKVSVGYAETISNHICPRFVGCRTSSGDIVAFLFAKTHVFTGNQEDAVQRCWTGTVKATFYEHLGTTERHSNTGASWNKGNIGATLGVTALNQKKGVCSEQGRTALQHGGFSNSTAAKFGALLAIIEMKYCSTVGLINFGVLPKPSLASISSGTDEDCRVIKKAKTEKTTIDLTGEEKR